MTKKTKTLILSICIVVGIVLIGVQNFVITFDGYRYNIEDARKSSESYAKMYADGDYITIEKDNEIFDLIINNDLLHIIKIDRKGLNFRPKYRVKSTATYSIDEKTREFNANNQYNWSNTSKLSSTNRLKWCIVSKSFNINNDNLEAFEFRYEDEIWNLCYQFVEP